LVDDCCTDKGVHRSPLAGMGLPRSMPRCPVAQIAEENYKRLAVMGRLLVKRAGQKLSWPSRMNGRACRWARLNRDPVPSTFSRNTKTIAVGWPFVKSAADQFTARHRVHAIPPATTSFPVTPNENRMCFASPATQSSKNFPPPKIAIVDSKNFSLPTTKCPSVDRPAHRVPRPKLLLMQLGKSNEAAAEKGTALWGGVGRPELQ